MELGDQWRAFRNVLNDRFWYYRRRNFRYRYTATNIILQPWICLYVLYEGWNFNSGNYLFTTDTK